MSADNVVFALAAPVEVLVEVPVEVPVEVSVEPMVDASAPAPKEKKPRAKTLPAKFSVLLHFIYWMQKNNNLAALDDDNIIDNLHLLASVDEQQAFVQTFFDDKKDIAKEIRKTVAAAKKALLPKKPRAPRAPRAPKPAVADNADPDAEAETKPKRGRAKKPTVVSTEQKPDIVAELVALANTPRTAGPPPASPAATAPAAAVDIFESDSDNSDTETKAETTSTAAAASAPKAASKAKAEPKAEPKVKEPKAKVEKAEKAPKPKAEPKVKEPKAKVEKAEKAPKPKADPKPKVAKSKPEVRVPTPVASDNEEDNEDDNEDDDEEETSVVVKVIDGKKFLVDADNILYDFASQEEIGTFDPHSNSVLLN